MESGPGRENGGTGPPTAHASRPGAASPRKRSPAASPPRGAGGSLLGPWTGPFPPERVRVSVPNPVPILGVEDGLADPDLARRKGEALRQALEPLPRRIPPGPSRTSPRTLTASPPLPALPLPHR